MKASSSHVSLSFLQSHFKDCGGLQLSTDWAKTVDVESGCNKVCYATVASNQAFQLDKRHPANPPLMATNSKTCAACSVPRPFYFTLSP